MGPEIFRIFLQHVVVNVYKISNYSEVNVWNASFLIIQLFGHSTFQQYFVLPSREISK